ncbi:hypothetical protein HZA56_14180 [Candidatus Poribacteria bacterium]|nr:hypothetical protein [Candidatus Poribacteria bacterium]
MKNSTADLIKVIRACKAWIHEIDRFHATFVTGADLSAYDEDILSIWLISHRQNQSNRAAFVLTLQVAQRELRRRRNLIGAF